MLPDPLVPALRFHRVNYSASGVPILKNITGIFPKGKITAVVGPSGAGKSTLFRLCNGLRPPDSGEIYVNEKPIADYDPPELRRKVGIALQNAPMVDGTVMDNLELPKKLQGKRLSEREAFQWMDLVGLESRFLHHPAKELSGGQRQKVSIARTLVNRPEILLLDEITSSLDPVSTQDIEELILRINGEFGTTILWITHALEQAIRIGNYTWVLMDGELAASGEISLLQSPADERVKRFVKGEED